MDTTIRAKNRTLNKIKYINNCRRSISPKCCVLHHPCCLGSGLYRRSVCCSVGWLPLLLDGEEVFWAPYWRVKTLRFIYWTNLPYILQVIEFFFFITQTSPVMKPGISIWFNRWLGVIFCFTCELLLWVHVFESILTCKALAASGDSQRTTNLWAETPGNAERVSSDPD